MNNTTEMTEMTPEEIAEEEAKALRRKELAEMQRSARDRNRRALLMTGQVRELSEQDLATYLGTSPAHVERLRENGTGPAWEETTKGTPVYRIGDVEGWLQDRVSEWCARRDRNEFLQRFREQGRQVDESMEAQED